MFVGDSLLARELAYALDAQGGNRVLGALIAPLKSSEASVQNGPPPLQILGDHTQLVEVVQRTQCDEVVVVLPDAQKDLVKTLVEDCYRAHVRFRMVPDVYDMLLDHMNFTLVGDIPLLGMRGSRIEGINFGFKRVFDIVVSTILLVRCWCRPFSSRQPSQSSLPTAAQYFIFRERIGYRRKHFHF